MTVAELEERIESQSKHIVMQRRELDATFRANDVLREENRRLKEELAQAVRAWPELVKNGIKIGKIT